MKFADQAAVISCIGDQPCDERGISGKGLVAIARVVQTGRIHSSHKTGAAWCTDRTLTKGVCERNATLHQAVNHWGGDVLITEGSDRVEPLLVRAIPENIRGRCGQGRGAKALFRFQEKTVAAIFSCRRHLAAKVLSREIRMSGCVRFSKHSILIQCQWSVLNTASQDSPRLASNTAAATHSLRLADCLLIDRGLVCSAVVLLS